MASAKVSVSNGMLTLLEATSVTNACIEYVDLTIRKSLKKNPELNSIERIIAAAHLVEAIRLIAEKNEHKMSCGSSKLCPISHLAVTTVRSYPGTNVPIYFAFDFVAESMVSSEKSPKSTLPGLKKFYGSNKVKL